MGRPDSANLRITQSSGEALPSGRFAPAAKLAARSLVHAALGVAFAISTLMFPRLYVLLAAVAVTLIFGIADLGRLLIPVLNSRFTNSLALFLRHKEDTHVTGATYFLLGATATVLLFPEKIAALAILFLAFGDPVAGVVGRLSGKAKLWGRTMEGDLACLAACVAAALVTIRIVGAPSWTVGLAGALAATVFQALPLRVNDNLTIPIGSAAAMLLLEAFLRTLA